jgi:hypothetical protein
MLEILQSANGNQVTEIMDAGADTRGAGIDGWDTGGIFFT